MNDFFSQQEQSRRNTTLLIVLFVCAVILIIVAVYLAVTAGLFFGQMFIDQGAFVHGLWNGNRFLWVAGITVLLVGSGSIYRMHQLSQGGGAVVAEMLGGERIVQATEDPLLRRLCNVVEEMAIASGVPVPPLYLMQQDGINAFAAGFGVRDVVIAVTRGATELLTRDELQGVIAHEFSHILNGDTHLKMRLMGLLFGITLISDAGILMMTTRSNAHYSSAHRFSRDRGSHPAIIVIGFLIFLAGTIGAIFADMIKRAVSRQREFLADAAAVQFTRNPAGIAGALKVIGGFKSGSRVNHAATRQASHFFFSNALKSQNRDWWATHPPLIERIRRLEPRFRGEFRAVDAASRSSMVSTETATAFAGQDAVPALLMTNVDDLMDRVGKPDADALQCSRALVARIPDALLDCAREPFGARALVYALLLDQGPGMRKTQLRGLQGEADRNVFRETLRMRPLVDRLDVELRLPLLEIALPTLKTLSRAQFDRFRASVRLLITSDGQIGLFEYMLQRMLLRHLYPVFLSAGAIAVRYDAVSDIAEEAGVIIAILIGHGNHASPEKVYEAAMRELFGKSMPDAQRLSFVQTGKLEKHVVSELDRALKKIERANPDIRRRMLRASLFTILADGKTATAEIELLRTIADALDAPMPPLEWK